MHYFSTQIETKTVIVNLYLSGTKDLITSHFPSARLET